MRTSRVQTFRKKRHRKLKSIIFFAVVLPSISIIVGYLITSLIILPNMQK